MTAPDIIRAKRRIALHRKLVRLRRISRELDNLLTPPDPWTYAAEPVDWRLTATTIGEREAAGRELARAGVGP